MAADPAEVASNVYTIMFENERVRLLEARLAPGDSSAMHGHPDYVVYNLAKGKVRSAHRPETPKRLSFRRAPRCGGTRSSIPPRT
jgi:hypothetical protein